LGSHWWRCRRWHWRVRGDQRIVFIIEQPLHHAVVGRGIVLPLIVGVVELMI